MASVELLRLLVIKATFLIKRIRYHSLEAAANTYCLEAEGLLKNQSRAMCGKWVGLGLLPSDSLESQFQDFHKIAHIKFFYGVERLHKSFFKP